MASATVKGNVAPVKTMKRGNWASAEMLLKYVDEEDEFKQNGEITISDAIFHKRWLISPPRSRVRRGRWRIWLLS